MLVLIQVKNVQCQLHVMVEQHASIIYVLVQRTAISPIIFALYDNSLNHVGFFFFYLTNFILLIAWYVRYVDSWNSKFSNLFKSFISVYLGSACALIDYCQRNSQCIRGYCICNSDQVVDANGYCISKLSNPLEQRGWNKFETKTEKKTAKSLVHKANFRFFHHRNGWFTLRNRYISLSLFFNVHQLGLLCMFKWLWRKWAWWMYTRDNFTHAALSCTHRFHQNFYLSAFLSKYEEILLHKYIYIMKDFFKLLKK